MHDQKRHILHQSSHIPATLHRNPPFDFINMTDTKDIDKDYIDRVLGPQSDDEISKALALASSAKAAQKRKKRRIDLITGRITLDKGKHEAVPKQTQEEWVEEVPQRVIKFLIKEALNAEQIAAQSEQEALKAEAEAMTLEKEALEVEFSMIRQRAISLRANALYRRAVAMEDRNNAVTDKDYADTHAHDILRHPLDSDWYTSHLEKLLSTLRRRSEIMLQRSENLVEYRNGVASYQGRTTYEFDAAVRMADRADKEYQAIFERIKEIEEMSEFN